MSLFDLPSTDVLFSHIFSNLRLLDIWNLRLVSIEFHNLCWDYFIKVCKALSIILQSHHSRDGEFLGFGASINIIRKCKKIKCLEIKGHNSKFFEEILHAIIMNESVILKRVCFIGVNFGSVPVVVLDSFSKRCGELEELEVCYALLNSIHDHFVIKVLEFCKHSLLRLSLRDMLSPLVHPLCLQPLTSLKHLSVANCSQVSSEGCLEELFRTCSMLEVVDLRQTKSVNNRTLLVLMEYCKHLKQVFLEGCVLVTVTPSLVKLSKERQVSVDLELQTDSDLSAKTPGQI